MNEQAQFEVESFLKLSAADLVEAQGVRAAWYQAVRRFFERCDYFVLPSSQVFPFDAKLKWPTEIAGRTMDTYHRWMEGVAMVSMSGCPALNVPVGFNARGLDVRALGEWTRLAATLVFFEGPSPLAASPLPMRLA